MGRGKTYLVDTFYDCLPFSRKLRVHFHRFMQRVHTELTSLEGEKNPLEIVAGVNALLPELQAAAPPGIKVANVEIKHVDLDESMIRAIAKQAEAERERRAKIIHADGEYQAAQRLREAAAIIEPHPTALQLR